MKGKAEPVTVSLTDELRTRLDLEAVRRSVEAGRPVSRSAVARELLERAIASVPAYGG
jgi:Arc/MetJ-type ribon-helix-helix transcriptional regulator